MSDAEPKEEEKEDGINILMVWSLGSFLHIYVYWTLDIAPARFQVNKHTTHAYLFCIYETNLKYAIQKLPTHTPEKLKTCTVRKHFLKDERNVPRINSIKTVAQSMMFTALNWTRGITINAVVILRGAKWNPLNMHDLATLLQRSKI